MKIGSNQDICEKKAHLECGLQSGNITRSQLYIIFNIGISCLRCLKFHGISVWISILVHMDYLRIWNSRNSIKNCSKIGFIAVDLTELSYLRMVTNFHYFDLNIKT